MGTGKKLDQLLQEMQALRSEVCEAKALLEDMRVGTLSDVMQKGLENILNYAGPKEDKRE